MNLRKLRLQQSSSKPILSQVPLHTIENIEQNNGCKVSTAIQLADALDELCRDETAE